jgi:hypothetical protein
MFATPDFAYVHLPKTGGTQITQVLREVVGDAGRVFAGAAKHRRADENGCAGRPVIGSIRNPWDWYVSLWMYDIESVGELRLQVTRRQRQRATGALDPVRRLLEAVRVRRWKRAYEAPTRARFLYWLQRVHSPKLRRGFAGTQLAQSWVPRHFGYMTYLYLYLYLDDPAILADDRFATRSDDLLDELMRPRLAPIAMIRQDALVDDLAAALVTLGCAASTAQAVAFPAMQQAAKGRVNSSGRGHVSDYFTADAVAMVGERDGFVARLHGYSYPG